MPKASERGFTLIELMITAAIVGTLAALAAGYSGDFFARSRLNELARGVYTATSIAHAEAVRNSRHALVEFESDRCVAFIDSLTGGTQWKYDSATDVTLYTYLYSSAKLTSSDLTVDSHLLTSTTSTSGSINPSFIFNSSGYSVQLNAANTLEPFSEVSITFKNKNITSTNVLRRITATAAGAIRVTNN